MNGPTSSYILLVCIVVGTQLAGCSSDSDEDATSTDTIIVYSGFAQNNPYWSGLGAAAAAEAEAKGVTFTDLTLPDATGPAAERAAKEQKESIDDAIKTNPSAIILGAIDSTVFTDTLATAAAAGIPVLAADTALTIPAATAGGTPTADPNMKCLVQTDNLKSAHDLGKYICSKLAGATGTALVMAGTVGHQTGDDRQAGVAEELTACGETVVKEYGNWDGDVMKELATQYVASTPDLNVIFAPCGAGGVAVGEYIHGEGLSSKVSVFSFDGQEAEFQAIKAGQEVATMKQDNVRIGQESINMALAILNDQPFLETDLIPAILVDSKNVSTYLVDP